MQRHTVSLILLIVVSIHSSNGQWALISDPSGYAQSLVSHQGSLIMSVAFGSSGLWRSTNNGTTWLRAQTDPVYGYGALGIASDGTTVYAARGTGRMVRSTNNGIDWVAANDGLPSAFNAYAVTAARSTVLCGGAFTGGVYASTDGGVSWTESSVGLASRDISVLAAKGDTVFAGTSDGKVSRSFDGGQSWTNVTPGSYTVNTSVVAIYVTDSTVFLGDGIGFSPGILRSTDWGISWNTYMSGIDETNSGHAYGFAVIDTFQFTGMGSGSSTGGIYKRSINAPEWTKINADQMIGGTPPVTSDTVYLYMTTMLASGTTLLAGFGGSGLYRSMDLGTTWQQITSDAGNINEERGALGENNGTLYVGGSASGVFISTDNGAFWNEYNANVFSSFGFSSFAFADTVSFSGHLVNGGVKRSTDGGRIWFPVNSGLSNFDVRRLSATGNTLFAGTGGGVFVSSNLGDSWSSTTMTSTVNALLASGNTVLASQLNQFSRSSDLGQTWAQVTNGVPSNWNAWDFAKMGNRWFAGGGATKVLTSTDDGLSWSDISGTIPGPIFSLATAGDTLYAATSVVVYYTTDLGQTWTQIPNDGFLATPSIHALMVKGGYVYAGMTGSGALGAYRRTVPGTTFVELTNKTVPEGFTLEQNYPNPFNPTTTITFGLPHNSAVSLKVFDILGQEIESLVLGELGPGTFSIKWNAQHVSSGIYFYRLEAGDFVETRKLVLMK